MIEKDKTGFIARYSSFKSLLFSFLAVARRWTSDSEQIPRPHCASSVKCISRVTVMVMENVHQEPTQCLAHRRHSVRNWSEVEGEGTIEMNIQ